MILELSKGEPMKMTFLSGNFPWPMNANNEHVNLTYLYQLGFTYDSIFNLISIAGLIVLKDFDIYKTPTLNFDELNELIDLHYDLKFHPEELVEVAKSIKYYYKNNYKYCYEDLHKAYKKCINPRLKQLIKRYKHIVGEMQLNGITSPALTEFLETF